MKKVKKQKPKDPKFSKYFGKKNPMAIEQSISDEIKKATPKRERSSK